MQILTIIFFVSLLLGQFGGIQITPGITVFLHDIFSLSILILFTIRRFKNKKQIQGSLTRPLVYFASVCVISLLLNVAHFSYIQLLFSSLYLWRFILYAGLYFVVVNESFKPEYWLRALFFTGTGVAVLGFVQYIFYPSLRNLLYAGWDEHYYRLFSTLLDPNFTGLFLVLTFFVGLGLYSSKIKTWILLCELLVIVATILTYSRSTFLAFGAGLLVYIFLSKKYILFLICLLGALFYAGLPTHGVDVNSLFRMDSTNARVHSYVEDISLVKLSPVIGIGYNTLRYQASRERMLDVDGITSRDAGGLNSSILVIIVTTGFIGFGMFVFLGFRVFRILTRNQSMLSYSALASAAAILVHSLFNNSLFYAWILIFIWIHIGSIEKKNILESVKKKKV